MMINLVDHYFAKDSVLPAKPGCLYQYVVAANGIFVRAERFGLSAMIWVASTADLVRGLAVLEPFVKIPARVPRRIVARMVELAYIARSREILYYLTLSGERWELSVPDQVQSGGSVRPVDPFYAGREAIIEVHSHHHMQPFFSGADDNDEKSGFRIYAVIGNLYEYPSILVRVGIYGHFWQIPASWVFDLPAGIQDALFIHKRSGEYAYSDDYVDVP